MGSLLLHEGEELQARFRPHPLAYARAYAWGLLWLAWGAIGLLAQLAFPDLAAAGAVGFGLSALLHPFLLKATHHRGFFPALLWAILSLGAAAGLLVGDATPLPAAAWMVPATLALLPAIVVVAAAELDRRLRRFVLTNRRIVVRGGLAQRHEHTIDLERIQGVRATQGPVGQACRFGRLTLVFSSRVKPKTGEIVEETEVLNGVPRFDDTRHRLDTVLADLQLSDRERRRSTEDRRLKESMRRLAAWAGREGA